MNRNENLAGPNYQGGISVISPRGPILPSNYIENDRKGQTRSSRPVHTSTARQHGVVHSPGGRQDGYKEKDPHRGSMDSIESVRSASLSFDSALSSGSFFFHPAHPLTMTHRYPSLKSAADQDQGQLKHSLNNKQQEKRSVGFGFGVDNGLGGRVKA